MWSLSSFIIKSTNWKPRAALNWWIIWKVLPRNILPTFCLQNIRIYDGIRRLFLLFDGLFQKFNALMALKYVQMGLYWHISQLLNRRKNTLGITLSYLQNMLIISRQLVSKYLGKQFILRFHAAFFCIVTFLKSKFIFCSVPWFSF